MESFLLKIETTGLKKTDLVLQICLIDLNGQIIYLKTFGGDFNEAFIYNNISLKSIKNLKKFEEVKELITEEINQLVYKKILYSYNLEFDKQFINLSPGKWIDTLSLLPRKLKIPNKPEYQKIPSPCYRKSLNFLDLLYEKNLINNPEDVISLNF